LQADATSVRVHTMRSERANIGVERSHKLHGLEYSAQPTHPRIQLCQG
jgi:hypothetical protein